MQYAIWLLLAVFCLIPVVVSQVIIKHEARMKGE